MQSYTKTNWVVDVTKVNPTNLNKIENQLEALTNEINSMSNLSDFKVVQALPTQDISTTTMYLVRNTETTGSNLYDEWVYANGNWEKIGDTNIDFSNYYTKSQVDDLIPEIPENVSYFKNDMEYLTEKINQTVSGNSVILNKTRNYKLKLSLKPSEITQDGTPSPDSPISVNTVTGNNTITIQGKNLFDKDNANILNAYIDRTTTTITSINNNRIVWIPCNSNTTYTISRMNGFQPNVAWTEITPAIGVNSYGQVKAENNVATITTGATANYLIVRVYNENVDTETIETILNSLQIEIGSQATPYEPYQSQSQNYSINLGSIEYAKIGSAEDNIYRDDNGDWYFEEHIGKKVLNGTENWLYSTLSNDTIASAFVRGLGGKNLSTYMCNKFPYLTIISAYTTVEYCGTNGDAMRLGVFKSRLNTADLQGFTSWLSQNNIKVYFELATPTTTQITDTTLINQLENLYQNAIAYEGTTNVSQTNSDLPFKFDIKAKIELDDYATKEYVNDLVGNIETALGGI